jgi:hypothetical protein
MESVECVFPKKTRHFRTSAGSKSLNGVQAVGGSNPLGPIEAEVLEFQEFPLFCFLARRSLFIGSWRDPWYVQLGKQQVKLADGPKNAATEAAA